MSDTKKLPPKAKNESEISKHCIRSMWIDDVTFQWQACPQQCNNLFKEFL